MASSPHPASHDAPSSSYLYCGANPGGSGPVSTVYKTGVVKQICLIETFMIKTNKLTAQVDKLGFILAREEDHYSSTTLKNVLIFFIETRQIIVCISAS